MARPVRTHDTPPSASILAGASRRDITPPVGIYNRLWGAAKTDTATGIHRPLLATALAMAPRDGGGPPLLLIGIDASWFRSRDEERGIRRIIAEHAGVPMDRLIVNCSHTHAAVSLASIDRDKPGGELVVAYLDQLTRAMSEAGREAVKALEPATLTWATGRCSLAGNRNMPDAAGGRMVCGYNPDIPADDTVLVGRVTRDADDRGVIATVVHYACHPTTLAWDNPLISPDFVGGVRDVIEPFTAGAPSLFLQGFSGDLGPKHQYVGDTEVADAGGRYLGHCAVAALASMLPPRQRLAYRGAVESGTALGVWRPETFEPSTVIAAEQFDISLRIKPMPSEAELEQELAQTTDRVMRERVYRNLQKVKSVGPGPETKIGAWVWRIGNCVLMGVPVEPYSRVQMALREAAGAEVAVLPTMTCNGAANGYVCPDEAYEGPPVYQVVQTPFDLGSQQRLLDALRSAAQRMGV